MNVYRIYILILDLFHFPPLLMIDKKEEKDFEFIYAYLSICIYWVYTSCVLQNGENNFESLNKKGEKVFGKRIFDLCMFLSPCWCIYICFVSCTSLNILLFIVMHELKGASMKLNFNPCIYNSMSFVIIKKGEIVGPKAHHSSFDDDKLMWL